MKQNCGMINVVSVFNEKCLQLLRDNVLLMTKETLNKIPKLPVWKFWA